MVNKKKDKYLKIRDASHPKTRDTKNLSYLTLENINIFLSRIINI